MTYRRLSRSLILILLFVALAACRTAPPTALPTEVAPATVPPAEATAPPATEPEATEAVPAEPTPEPESTAEPSPTAEPSSPGSSELPASVVYNLGETTIIQAGFPEDSRFREMPVRLEGVMAVPEPAEQGAPYPVVLILHGTHPGCPVDDMGVDRWPCDPEVEQPNYMGYEYLVRELAARGYVALSININAESTFGFGEPRPGERVRQIVDRHLSALAEAAIGGENGFGVELQGVADVRRLVLAGHSRGGEIANWLAGADEASPNLASPFAYANYGYGPVQGLLLIASAVSLFDPLPPTVPLASIVAACDGDVVTGEGQLFYDRARLLPDNAPAVSVVLDSANHNGFNEVLRPEGLPFGRTDCDAVLAPEVQRAFLVDFATDFLTTLFVPNPEARLSAAARMGLDATAPAPTEILGLAARVSALPAAADRQRLLIPAAEGEMETNLLGGPIVAAGVTTLYCEAGFAVPSERPGSEPCQRPNITIPGYPSMAVVNWAGPGGEWRFELPEGARDLSRFTTLSLRAAVDPLSSLNAEGAAQGFSLRLTDGSGHVATLAMHPDEPALAYPAGSINTEEGFFGPHFSGLVPLTAIRLPLRELPGIDLNDIAEIALVFDQTATGTLFLNDIELIRPPHVIGAYSTLLKNAGGDYAGLSGVGRLTAASSCTGTFINPTGDPDAPAYLITNGHCAQDWTANEVTIDGEPREGWAATFNYFIDAAEGERVRVPVNRVAYSTMKGRDVAILELDATAGELIERGIQPLALAEAPPPARFDLRVTGVPVSSVPADLAYLRQESCRANGRANLLEFIWHFNDAIANACQDIYGGSSGSPVFVGDDPAIVALINTTNIGAFVPCALGAPCEVRPEGTIMVPDTSYATPVDGLAACFGVDGRFDVAAAGCSLDDGRQLELSGAPVQAIQSVSVSPDGVATPAAWNTTVAGDLPYFSYKTGRVETTDCRDAAGYGPVLATAEFNLIVDPIPPEEGVYALCVQAGEHPVVDDSWQPLKWATMVWAEIDNTPPRMTPQLSFMSDGGGGLWFEPIFAPPELSHFEALVGPAGATDCADRDAYQPYFRIPITIPAEQMPAQICLISFDVAGNESEPYEMIVGRER